jgi:hypothetical protein
MAYVAHTALKPQLQRPFGELGITGNRELNWIYDAKVWNGLKWLCIVQ